MHKIKIFLLLFSLILTSEITIADVYDFPSDIESISALLPEIESVKCKFKQEKYLKDIQKPVISGGNFEFIQNEGVFFNTIYPIKSTTDYSSKNNKHINDIINALSEKKYSKIEKDFNFFFENKKDNWILGFTPKKTSKAYNFLLSVTINGSKHINQIEIKQTNGNRTVIWFLI